MAILQFTGFESGSTTGTSAIAGTGSIQSSVKRSGTYAFRANPTTTATGSLNVLMFNASGLLATGSTADLYTTFYFRYATKPASASEPIATIEGTGQRHVQLRIDSAGKLSIYDYTGTIVGSAGTTVLSQDTWYKISLYAGTDVGGGTLPFTLNIDDTLELSGNAPAGDTNNCSYLALGKTTDENGQTVEYFYDDVSTSSTAFISGTYQVDPLVVNGDGVTMTWNAGTGASDYQEVDEIPPDDANYVQSPTTGNPNVALFTLTSGITGTISAVRALIRTRENTSVTSATKARIYSGGSTADSGTNNGTTAFVAQGVLSETDPATGSAWTSGGINGVEMGAVENNAVAVRCSFVMGEVLYSPSAPPANSGNMLLVM